MDDVMSAFKNKLGQFATGVKESYLSQFSPLSQSIETAIARKQGVGNIYDSAINSFQQQIDDLQEKINETQSEGMRRQFQTMLDETRQEQQKAISQRDAVYKKSSPLGFLSSGARAGLATAGTIGLALGGLPAAAGYLGASGGFGGAIAGLTGQDVLQGVARGVGEAPLYAGAYGLGARVAGPVTSRIVPPQGRIQNIGQLVEARLGKDMGRMALEKSRALLTPANIARNIAQAGAETAAGSALLGVTQEAETPEQLAQNVAREAGTGAVIGAGARAIQYGLQAGMGAGKVGARQLQEQWAKWLEGKPKNVREAYQFYSPNIAENTDLNYAINELPRDRQKWYRTITEDIDKKLGLKSKKYDAIGTWEDGAENTIVEHVYNVRDFDQLRYNGALKGLVGNQKAGINFLIDPRGSKHMYLFTVDGDDANLIKQAFDNQGMKYNTIVPGKGGRSDVYVYTEKETLGKDVAQFLKDNYGATIKEFKGYGEFLGGGTRAEGTKAYTDVIRRYQEKFPNRRFYKEVGGYGVSNLVGETPTTQEAVMSRLGIQPGQAQAGYIDLNAPVGGTPKKEPVDSKTFQYLAKKMRLEKKPETWADSALQDIADYGKTRTSWTTEEAKAIEKANAELMRRSVTTPTGGVPVVTKGQSSDYYAKIRDDLIAKANSGVKTVQYGNKEIPIEDAIGRYHSQAISATGTTMTPATPTASYPGDAYYRRKDLETYGLERLKDTLRNRGEFVPGGGEVTDMNLRKQLIDKIMGMEYPQSAVTPPVTPTGGVPGATPATPVTTPVTPKVINMTTSSGNPAKSKGDFTLEYKSVDGWRGYYDAVPKKNSGWSKLDDMSDWMTGDYDDAGEHAASVVQQKLSELNGRVKALGGEMVVVTAPTSNAFSTGYDVFVKGIKPEALNAPTPMTPATESLLQTRSPLPTVEKNLKVTPVPANAYTKLVAGEKIKYSYGDQPKLPTTPPPDPTQTLPPPVSLPKGRNVNSNMRGYASPVPYANSLPAGSKQVGLHHGEWVMQTPDGQLYTTHNPNSDWIDANKGEGGALWFPFALWSPGKTTARFPVKKSSEGIVEYAKRAVDEIVSGTTKSEEQLEKLKKFANDLVQRDYTNVPEKFKATDYVREQIAFILSRMGK